VAFPQPVPGLIIRYSYLWHDEHVQGREEGRKHRPCAIIASIRIEGKSDIRVLVLPITHLAPPRPDLAVEIPTAVKLRLGLDDERSWIILSEWNAFMWPGPDLRRLAGADDASIAYGMLPPALFRLVRDRLLALVKDQIAKPVPRS
jgi:hypothetical protein